MPYFVFRIKPFAQIERVAEFDGFAQASAHAKTLRAAQPKNDNAKIKVMFAQNPQLAEDLLCQLRDPSPAGDE